MTHDLTHCSATDCCKRMQCRRYLAHLDKIDRGLKGHYPYLIHITDLGWGKTYTRDTRRGCCEFLPVEDNQTPYNHE